MISVVVCTYNRSGLLRAALASLRKMQVPPDLAWELIIVDNNSSDDTETVVREYQHTAPFDVRYVFEGIQGHSRARNRGIVESRGGILAFTDDDVVVDDQWLTELRSCYRQSDCLGAGGRIVPLWRCAKPAWLKEAGPYALMRAVVSFDEGDGTRVLKTPPFGANMSFRKTAFERYGLFRTDLGRNGTTPMGSEDTEFGRRLLRNSETIVYNPRAVVFHPVESERATRQYFQRWYFEYGRAAIRQTATRPAGRDRIRWQRQALRRLGASVVRWTLALRADRRLYYRLAISEALGRIREAFSRATRVDGRTIPRLAEPPKTSPYARPLR